LNYFFSGVLLFFLAGVVTIFVRKDEWKSIIFLIAASGAQILILPTLFSSLIFGNSFSAAAIFSEPIGAATLRLDPLASVFALIISAGALLAAIYSLGYMKHYYGGKYSLSAFYFFFGLLISSMLLVVVVQNSILFLIVWELMSVSSFFLVVFENDKEDVRKAGLYYLIAMQIGASFLIAAFSWLGNLSGSYDFASFKNILSAQNYTAIILFSLFFIGFGTKAGFVPFHTWLPRAHPAAPTGVSAIMSGVMIKTGIYGILRIILLSGVPEVHLAYAVFIISFVTGIVGILNAISQKDIKKFLAYSSIENIGIIGMGIGLGMLGAAYNIPLIEILGYLGAILHSVNHFIFKSMLFYGAGIVYQNTNTRNIEKLGGLIKFMPVTSILFLTGAIAISGLPMFNGFISEFAIYLGMAKGFASANVSLNIFMLIGFSGLALIGIMAMVGFTKLFGIAFLGSPREPFDKTPHEGSTALILPMIVLSVFIFVVGIFPITIIQILNPVLRQFNNINIEQQFSSVFSLYTSLTGAFILFALIIFIVFLIRVYFLRNKKVEQFKTWDCGYQAVSSRLQYTGSSYSLPFLELVAEFVPQKTVVETQYEIFPAEAHLKTSQHDFAERLFVQPVLKFIRRFLTMFAWIQSGRMQQYILYGLIFLVIILIWIFGAM